MKPSFCICMCETVHIKDPLSSYDTIWFYLPKIVAQRLNYKVQYERKKGKTQYDQKTKLLVQQ